MRVLDDALDELSGPPTSLRTPEWLVSNQTRAQNEHLVRDASLAAVRLARQGAWRLARRDGVAVPEKAALAADLAECIELHRAAWLASSRPGGLEDSLRHLPEPR